MKSSKCSKINGPSIHTIAASAQTGNPVHYLRKTMLLFITVVLLSCGGNGDDSNNGGTSWTYNTEWLDASTVWAVYSFCRDWPLDVDYCGVEGRDAAEKAGAAVWAWQDMRFHTNWPDVINDIIDYAHSDGRQWIGSLSMIWLWQEQAQRSTYLDSAISRDPFGNINYDNTGVYDPGDTTRFTALHPLWEAMLTDNALAYVDGGVDALMVDEGAFIGIPMEFNPTVVAGFNDYLTTILTSQERENLATSLGFTSFDQFDYAKVWRDQLPPGTTMLDETTWNSRWNLNIPLWEEYDRYRHTRGISAMERIITAAKTRAVSLGRELPVGFNIGPAQIWGMPFVHLADFIDPEIYYAVPASSSDQYNYFPEARAAPTIKLFGALNLQANIRTAMPTAEDLASRGRGNIESIYRILIADAYASGGRMYVEEDFFGIETNFDEISPYYQFVNQRPELIERSAPISARVGIVQLWEQYEFTPRRHFDGTAQILSDSGYQYDVIFGAEDVNREVPGPRTVLDETLLARHQALVIPQLLMCWNCGTKGTGLMLTENHAGRLLDYVKQGGLLIVQADPAEIAYGLFADTGPSANELLGYLQSGKVDLGSGSIVHIPQVLGPSYQATATANDAQIIRAQLTDVLMDNGIQPEIGYVSKPRAVSAFLYQINNNVVIHFVNYDHDIDTDTITPVNNLEINIDTSILPTATNYDVSWQQPETPNGSALLYQKPNERLMVTVPEINPWTVLCIKKSS